MHYSNFISEIGKALAAHISFLFLETEVPVFLSHKRTSDSSDLIHKVISEE